MLFAPNEPVRATMTHMPVSVAANTLVNVNEDPGLAGAMAHSSELVLSVVLVSSTSTTLAKIPTVDESCALFEVKNARSRSPCCTPAG